MVVILPTLEVHYSYWTYPNQKQKEHYDHLQPFYPIGPMRGRMMYRVLLSCKTASE
tara:strand:+ start:943 stop:1110 length:168 start_codon:yes stop_codon:yes gene_type:complete